MHCKDFSRGATVRIRAIIITIAALGMSGCVVKSLDLDSYPTGAIAVEAGTGSQFLLPARINYPLNREHVANGCLNARRLDIYWSSGARSSYTPRLCGTDAVYRYSVQRPQNHPGLANDLHAAQNRINQLAANQAAADRAAANALSAFVTGMAAGARGPALAVDTSPIYRRSLEPIVPVQQPVLVTPRSVNCTSILIGQTVQTMCN